MRGSCEASTISSWISLPFLRTSCTSSVTVAPLVVGLARHGAATLIVPRFAAVVADGVGGVKC